MRLPQILPYAALILLAEAAVGSVPDIVAAREGGMGLGSALIVAQLAQVAGTAFGAVVAGYLVGRRSPSVALVSGALLFYAGLIGIGHQPAHLLGWVVAVLAVAGAGLGMILTASLAVAADTGAPDRPYAVALLLLASVAAALLVDNPAFLLGVPALVIVAGVVVAGSLAITRFAAPLPAVEGGDGSALTLGSAVLGGGLIAAGVAATLWGLEPSSISAVLVGQSVGMTGIGSLGAFRAGLVIFGVIAIAGGCVLIGMRTRPGRSTLLAAAASGSAAFAAAGLLAVSGFTMPVAPPDRFGGPIGELTAVIFGAIGLFVGAWLLARGAGRRRAVALGGAALLVAVAAVVLIGATWVAASGAVVPLIALAATAFGAALVAAALRVVLSETPIDERGMAVAAGVAAAALGAMAGLLVGAGEGIRLAITGEGIGLASVALGVAAVLALGLAALLPGASATEAAEERAYST
jgi:hypothetical protein